MDNQLDHEALEQLAIDTFERVRAGRGYLAAKDALTFDLQILPGQARAGEGGVAFYLRMISWEGGVIRDVKEQEIWFVPAGADDARIPAYFEGSARAMQSAIDRGVDVERAMPHELVPYRAFRDPECKTAEQFAAQAGVPEPDVALAIEDLSGTEPIARNEALERAIDEDPDNVDAYLVYADWLTERGDPRGELISCTAPSAPPLATRRFADLLAKHERYFAGPFLSSERLTSYVGVSFHLGYFADVRIACDYQLSEEIPDFAAKALRGLMSLPSARFLHGITIGAINFAGNCDFDVLYPILVEAGPRPSMQRLFIGDTTSEEQEISWTRAGDLAPLCALYPNLRSLRVHAGSMQLAGALAYPRLEKLSIETGGLAVENVRAIAVAPLPTLTDLEIWFGSHGYGATSTIADLEPIFSGRHLPKLARLALKNCEYTDEIAEALVGSAILPRIRELDLSMGTLSDAGAERLLSNKRAFAHLAKLCVADNYLGAAAVASLADLGIEVDVGSRAQKRPYDSNPDRRYVSVGE